MPDLMMGATDLQRILEAVMNPPSQREEPVPLPGQAPGQDPNVMLDPLLLGGGSQVPAAAPVVNDRPSLGSMLAIALAGLGDAFKAKGGQQSNMAQTLVRDRNALRERRAVREERKTEQQRREGREDERFGTLRQDALDAETRQVERANEANKALIQREENREELRDSRDERRRVQGLADDIASSPFGQLPPGDPSTWTEKQLLAAKSAAATEGWRKTMEAKGQIDPKDMARANDFTLESLKEFSATVPEKLAAGLKPSQIRAQYKRELTRSLRALPDNETAAALVEVALADFDEDMADLWNAWNDQRLKKAPKPKASPEDRQKQNTERIRRSNEQFKQNLLKKDGPQVFAGTRQ